MNLRPKSNAGKATGSLCGSALAQEDGVQVLCLRLQLDHFVKPADAAARLLDRVQYHTGGTSFFMTYCSVAYLPACMCKPYSQASYAPDAENCTGGLHLAPYFIMNYQRRLISLVCSFLQVRNTQGQEGGFCKVGLRLQAYPDNPIQCVASACQFKEGTGKIQCKDAQCACQQGTCPGGCPLPHVAAAGAATIPKESSLSQSCCHDVQCMPEDPSAD